MAQPSPSPPGAGLPAVQRRKPPKLLMTLLVNPIMRAILRSPGHARLSGALALLTFTGRKSGRRYTIPVGYQREGDTVVIFTDSPWARNFDQPAEVTLRLAGRDVVGRAVTVRDPAAVLAKVEEYLRRNGPGSAARLGIRLASGREPARADLQAAIRGLGFVRIDLHSTDSSA